MILIEDLAHLNGDESRHRKRYQDIEELLKAGVDVYTTLDIQHIESIQDTIFSILGYSESKRIPDRVFDQAAQVEFVDIEPQRLQQRLLEQEKGGAAFPLLVISIKRASGNRFAPLCGPGSTLYPWVLQ